MDTQTNYSDDMMLYRQQCLLSLKEFGFGKDIYEFCTDWVLNHDTTARLKDQIKLLKLALKRQELYSDVELHYMKKELNNAKYNLKLKKQKRSKGFNNEFSKTDNSDTQRRRDDGLHSESKQPEESGKS